MLRGHLRRICILLLLGGVFCKHLVLLLEGDFLHLADFLFNSISCGESEVEVSSCNCVSGPFPSRALGCVLCTPQHSCLRHTHLELPCLLGGLALLSLHSVFFCQVNVFFALKSVLSDINVAALLSFH